MWHLRAEGGTSFNYNGDLSGDVGIMVPASKVTSTPNYVSIEIPGKDLLEFVAQHIRMQRISALEDATPEELIAGKV